MVIKPPEAFSWAGSSPVPRHSGDARVLSFSSRHLITAWPGSSGRSPTCGLAVKVNAVVVSTPAYRREFSRNDSPAGPDNFDPWVIRTVLNPIRAPRQSLAITEAAATETERVTACRPPGAENWIWITASTDRYGIAQKILYMTDSEQPRQP